MLLLQVPVCKFQHRWCRPSNPPAPSPLQVLIDSRLSTAERRSVFGFFSVPARLYPWAMLVLWQLLVPQASFLGHLCGLL